MIDAISQATKQGFLFVFDRVTGKPLWPVEERPVPASLMPGDQVWPTQPHPTASPPYARQRMTAEDVNPFILTPEERAAWKERRPTRFQPIVSYLPPLRLLKQAPLLPGLPGAERPEIFRQFLRSTSLRRRCG